MSATSSRCPGPVPDLSSGTHGLVPWIGGIVADGQVGSGSPRDGFATIENIARWSGCCCGLRGAGSYADRCRLRGDGSQRHGGTYLHTAHHSSIVRICYRHHPFFGQTVEIIRWLRRQTSDSLVIKLQDGLELAIPAWMLDPVACSLVHDAPAPL